MVSIKEQIKEVIKRLEKENCIITIKGNQFDGMNIKIENKNLITGTAYYVVRDNDELHTFLWGIYLGLKICQK